MRYNSLGSHWNNCVDCHCPPISREKTELLEGAIMGDASISGRSTTPYFILKMQNKKFLQWFSDKSGFIIGEVKDGHKDMNYVKSPSTDKLSFLSEWYTNEGKRFKNIQLSPLRTKIWYCCDGYLDWGKGRANPVMRIASENESDRPDYLKSLFSDREFDARFTGNSIYFTVDESKKLLEWMGTPPPGFKYKWVTESRKKYKSMKSDKQ
jgi:hypothetical protein